MAILLAATANWLKRPILRDSLRSMNSSGAKFFTSPASFTSTFSVSIRVAVAIPDTPFFIFSHVVSISLPKGVTAPIPVITILFFIFYLLIVFSILYKPLKPYLIKIKIKIKVNEFLSLSLHTVSFYIHYSLSAILIIILISSLYDYTRFLNFIINLRIILFDSGYILTHSFVRR